jgi:hypothetical protein
MATGRLVPKLVCRPHGSCEHYLDHRVGVANSRGSVSAFAAEACLVGVMAVSSHPLSLVLPAVPADTAVHNFSVLEPPVPHPAGGLSTRASVDYSSGEAAASLDAMRGIYRALASSPKPAAVRLQTGQDDVRPCEELRDRGRDIWETLGFDDRRLHRPGDLDHGRHAVGRSTGPR